MLNFPVHRNTPPHNGTIQTVALQNTDDEYQACQESDKEESNRYVQGVITNYVDFCHILNI